MNVVIAAQIPFWGGVALGVLFFGGLWLTIRRAAGSRHAGLWFAASSMLRTAAVLCGMFWLTKGRWQELLPCVAGFTLARLAVTRLAGTPLTAVAAAAAEEDVHAS